MPIFRAGSPHTSVPPQPWLVLGQRVRIRILEIFLFVILVWVGTLWASPSFPWTSPGSFLLSGFALFLFYAHAFLFNDWADSRESGSESTLFWSSLFLLGVGVVLIGLISVRSLPWIGLILISSWLYSHPRLRLKTVPLAASLLHFLAGSIQFLLGVSLVQTVLPSHAYLSVYFGLVLAGGHLLQEVEHHAQDQTRGVITQAVRFGPRVVAWASYLLFAASSLYLVCLNFFNEIPTILALSGLAVTLGQGIFFFLMLKEKWTAHHYRTVYRILFGLLGLFWYRYLLMGGST